MTGWLPLVLILAGPAGAGVAVWHNGWDTPWKLTAIAVAGALSATAANLLERELVRRREIAERTPLPARLSPEDLELWRKAVRSAVVQLRLSAGQQLDTMIRQGDPVDPVARVDAYRPRVRVDGRLVAWSELTRRWDAAPRRLVVLGDPGYGKTIAALTLVKHINAKGAKTPGAPVAELFAPADWQRWRAEHPEASLAQWLGEQLMLTHPQLGIPIEVARQLIDDELVLPILDGLDEIADVDDRRACAAAIDAYAGRGEPHRPFVLTCRTTDYQQLAPDLVGDDQRIELVGMQPDQIHQRLDEQTAGRPAWMELRRRQAAGEPAIDELFESPLYLAIALQIYRDGDPSELLTLPVAQARGRLWELLLATNAEGYRGMTAAQVRASLAWLATGLRRINRQRFMLHELYLLDSRPTKNLRAFRIIGGMFFGLSFGLFSGLGAGVGVRLNDGLVLGLPVKLDVGLHVGLVGGLLFGMIFALSVLPRPSVPKPLRWRARVQHATTKDRIVSTLCFGLAVGLFFGLLFGLLFGSVTGLFWGLFIGLAGGLVSFASDLLEGEVITADPPQRFAHATPDAVLNASRRNGLVVGLIVWLVFGLFFGLIGGLLNALLLDAQLEGVGGLLGRLLGGLFAGIQWLSGGLFFGLVLGLTIGLLVGLDAWLYHHWLRWRLVAQNVLPARLPAFLEWCAEYDRGWLRITDAYEFRHRELLDHLTPPEPDN